MKIIFEETKKFSKENWWIYLLFVFALFLVSYTGKGNLIEIIFLFVLNFFANICIMAMQSNFTNKKPKLGTFFQALGTLIFIFLGVYGLLYLGQSQYIIWQIAYILSALKTYLYFNKNYNFKIINTYFLIFLNIIFFFIFYKFFADNNISLLIQATGFGFSSTGFVVLEDKKRYFTILIGTWLIIIGSLLISYSSFLSGSLDGIALGYFILSLTVGIYYLKLLKKYL